MEKEIEEDNTTELFYKFKYNLYLFIKRIFDIIFGLIGVLILIPVTIIIKIISICTGDFNSIFYTQYRIGKNGKQFKFYKYRSMVPNADKILFEYLKTNSEASHEYKINKKLKYDPRITKIGKIIRKTSIDELPQFINVLKGDMSLIGNRPYLPRELDDMKNYYEDIIKTKPGITGYWQISGRSNLTFENRMKLEKYYSEHCSLKLDIKIFFKTFKVIFNCVGAD